MDNIVVAIERCAANNGSSSSSRGIKVEWMRLSRRERERMDIGAHMAPGGWAKPFGMVEVIVLVHVEYIIL